MNHQSAWQLLTNLADDTVEPALRADLEEHVADCAECSAWTAAAELVSLAAQPLDSGRDEHPDSLEICTFALNPEALSEFDRARTRKHLTSCETCATEVRLVTASVAQEETPERLSVPVAAIPIMGRPSMVAIAATLLLFLGVLLFTHVPATAPDRIVLNGGQLLGEETVDAVHSINIEDMAVASGAALTLRSESVAFGEGFSVDTSANLVVVTGSEAVEGRQPEVRSKRQRSQHNTRTRRM